MILQIKNKQKDQDARLARKTINAALHVALTDEKLFQLMNTEKITPVFSVLLTDNIGIKKLNAKFRGIEKETDVLSFPAIDVGDGPLRLIPKFNVNHYPDGHNELQMGDIVISLERVFEQAREIGHSYERELSFMTIHSFLHLLGYDHIDPNQEEIMMKRQKEIMHDLINKQSLQGDNNE